MICYAPMFLAAAIICLEKLFINDKKPEMASPVKPFLISSTLMLIASAAGYLVNAKVFTKIYSFTNYSKININDFSLESVINCIGDLISQIGWQGNQQLLSLKGVAGVLGVCTGFIALVILCRMIRRRSQNIYHRFIYLFIGASFIVCLIVYSQTSIYNCSYWIPILPFIILALIMGISSWLNDNVTVDSKINNNTVVGTGNNTKVHGSVNKALDKIKTSVFVIITCVLFICSIATMQNPYISWVPNDLTIKSVADWLVESGYTQGCGTFWNSDVITELSDGKIEMWTVSDMNELSTYQWLQETSHDTEKPDGKFFIITTPDEYTQNAEIWKLPSLTDYLVYGDDNYFVFAFDSVEEYLEM